MVGYRDLPGFRFQRAALATSSCACAGPKGRGTFALPHHVHSQIECMACCLPVSQMRTTAGLFCYFHLLDADLKPCCRKELHHLLFDITICNAPLCNAPYAMHHMHHMQCTICNAMHHMQCTITICNLGQASMSERLESLMISE